MLVIFTFSSRQRIGVSETYWLNFAFFKVLHLIEYAFLYVLMLRALTSGKTPSKKSYSVALLITILYAISDEMHQTFVPTREGTVRDVIIDSIGAISMMGILRTKRMQFLRKALCNA